MRRVSAAIPVAVCHERVVSIDKRQTPPSAYRCGGSSGWARTCRILTALIPVELSRRNASTSTNPSIIAGGRGRPVATRVPSLTGRRSRGACEGFARSGRRPVPRGAVCGERSWLREGAPAARFADEVTRPSLRTRARGLAQRPRRGLAQASCLPVAATPRPGRQSARRLRNTLRCAGRRGHAASAMAATGRPQKHEGVSDLRR